MRGNHRRALKVYGSALASHAPAFASQDLIERLRGRGIGISEGVVRRALCPPIDRSEEECLEAMPSHGLEQARPSRAPSTRAWVGLRRELGSWSYRASRGEGRTREGRVAPGLGEKGTGSAGGRGCERVYMWAVCVRGCEPVRAWVCGGRVAEVASHT